MAETMCGSPMYMVIITNFDLKLKMTFFVIKTFRSAFLRHQKS